TVVLVEGQPVHAHAVAVGAVELLQGDLPLGPIHHPVGDASLAAAGPVVGPLLGQEQLGVDEGLVAPASDAEVDGDDAVRDLADAAQILLLHAGGLVALFECAGLVDDADGAEGLGVGSGTELLDGVGGESVSDQGEIDTWRSSYTGREASGDVT